MEFRLKDFEGEYKDEVVELAKEAGSEKDEIDKFLEEDTVKIAIRQSSFLGFIAYKFMDETMKIEELGVPEGQRNQGVGRNLLVKVRSKAERENVERLVIETSNDNIPALALYQKFGFRIKKVNTGELVEHHGGEETGWGDIPVRDRIILEMKL